MKSVTFIVFGATGDLAKRKIIPAIYRLVAKKKLTDFIIIGAARDDVNAEAMLAAAQQFISDCDETLWRSMQERSYYKKVDFDNQQDFVALHEYVQASEKRYGLTGNRLLYCATAATFFCPITSHCAQVGLAQRLGPDAAVWHRFVYEKPFGHDLKSAHEINECIAQYFDESQIYRIDHYLTKEIVNNIAMIRFTNIVFEPLWSNRYVSQVQIVLSETIGIEMRGAYYDHFGALRDMVQNHMLELLALICMETPQKLTGDFIRTERAKVLEKVRFVDGILGQYDGYQQEKDVAPHSQTETYASLSVVVDNPRWKDVPFYLKTGKHLNKKETVIHIQFKQVECLLLRGCPVESNWLTIRVAPEAVFVLTLNAKHPETDELVPIGMEFCHSCIFGLQTPQAYEVLLDEVIKGEQSISVRFDEIEYAWKLVDSITTQKLPLYPYARGSVGPDEEKEFEQKHGMKWRL